MKIKIKAKLGARSLSFQLRRTPFQHIAEWMLEHQDEFLGAFMARSMGVFLLHGADLAERMKQDGWSLTLCKGMHRDFGG